MTGSQSTHFVVVREAATTTIAQAIVNQPPSPKNVVNLEAEVQLYPGLVQTPPIDEFV